ncbi:hypothetical protein Tco_0245691 [Tanacetum coccineum]
MNHLGASSVRPFQCEVVSPNSGPLFRRGGGGGSVVFVPGTVGEGCEKVARCSFRDLRLMGLSGCPQDHGPITVRPIMWRIALQRLLRDMSEAWALCFLRSGVRWVCFLALSF